ncbi:hypothetical protein [Microbulbifer epialgicus]|uniref:Uncharacterized protein n=1 Tax=Microbulbifer epialgicus TaxID=393907 RepID=A0ABV4NTW9_9GAMM
MFGNNKREHELNLEKEKTKRSLIDACAGYKPVQVTTDSGEIALIQLEGIKSVRQEKKGWYYDDPDRNTLLIKYLDASWERLDMTVERFCDQTGYDKEGVIGV